MFSGWPHLKEGDDHPFAFVNELVVKVKFLVEPPLVAHVVQVPVYYRIVWVIDVERFLLDLNSSDFRRWCAGLLNFAMGRPDSLGG